MSDNIFSEESNKGNLNKKQESILGSLSLTLTNVSVLIILFGVIRETMYYNSFNIPIRYFMELSEMGLVTLDYLPILLLVIGITAFFSLLINTNFQHSTDKLINRTKGVLRKKILLFFKKQFSQIRTIVISLIGFFMSVDIAMLIIHNFTITLNAKLMLFLAMTLIIPIFVFAFHQGLKRTNVNVILNIFFVLILLYFSTYKTLRDISNSNSGKYTGTRIYTDDTVYVSNDSSFYIGKTAKYVFIHDVIKSVNAIIPTEKIKKIILVEN